MRSRVLKCESVSTLFSTGTLNSAVCSVTDGSNGFAITVDDTDEALRAEYTYDPSTASPALVPPIG